MKAVQNADLWMCGVKGSCKQQSVQLGAFVGK